MDKSLKIKLVAPFRTHFNVYSNFILSHREDYCRFWNVTEAKLKSKKMDYQSSIKAIDFLHKIDGDSSQMLFKKINEDGSNLSSEVFRVYCNDEFTEVLDKAAQTANQKLKNPELSECFKLDSENSLAFRIYDNMVGICEIDIIVDHSCVDTHLKDIFDEIQEWSNIFMQTTISTFYTQTLYPLIQQIWHFDHKGEYIPSYNKNNRFPGLSVFNSKNPIFNQQHKEGKPMWVNRSLFINNVENKEFDMIYNHWLSLDPSIKEEVKAQIEQNKIYLGWGHNLITDHALAKNVHDAFEALHICQYFNVILEFTNKELSDLVDKTFEKRKKKKTKDLDQTLREFIENVNLILMQLRESQLNLQGNRRTFFDDIFSKWSLQMIKDNIDNKITYCKEKIEQLYKKETTKNQNVTEAILFIIGGVALIDFFVNVSHFAKNISANKPKMGPVNDGTLGLMDLATVLAPDQMIWIGILTLSLILLLFYIFQIRSR